MFDQSVFLQRLLKLGRWLAERPAPARDWYAGVYGDTRGFSEQLSNLQNSLLAAGHSAPEKANKSLVNVRPRPLT
jgi:hypothetical protein